MWVACYLPIALDLVKIPKFGIASSFGDEKSSSIVLHSRVSWKQKTWERERLWVLRWSVNPNFHSISELISHLHSLCPHLSVADRESMGFAMERNPELSC